MHSGKKVQNSDDSGSGQEPYQPLACSLYDVLEVAAMKHREISLRLKEETVRLVVHDVFAKGSEEFLEGLDLTSRQHVRLRLDSIQEIYDPATNKKYISDKC